MTTEQRWWPTQAMTVRGRAAVLTVSYNTLELTALLIWSLRRLLDWPDLQVLVVDNGSTDGSAEMLSELVGLGTCSVICNGLNLQHGPALNQGFSSLAAQRELPEWIWILDSDSVISRREALTHAIAAANGASIVGEPNWDPWLKRERFELYSLLIDPRQVWQPQVGPFADDGDPSWPLLDSALRNGLALVPFEFTENRYVIHRGRGTLAAVLANGERANPHYEWATDHHLPHFNEVPGAADRWEELMTQFRADVPRLTGPALDAACRRGPA